METGPRPGLDCRCMACVARGRTCWVGSRAVRPASSLSGSGVPLSGPTTAATLARFTP